MKPQPFNLENIINDIILKNEGHFLKFVTKPLRIKNFNDFVSCDNPPGKDENDLELLVFHIDFDAPYVTNGCYKDGKFYDFMAAIESKNPILGWYKPDETTTI
jgi:hypothetical protein